ncbi:uncharacterized protein K452DRAFT_238283 [Aplosporella prunicola CBS 121167]|uniref:Erythromycin esterase n=1 Tax=Aplosporella prunicola CBS 121167 TaxID=1176127 RepID=A0A6A6AWC2_9PEZI|nr:uncharacterized protein K452DRAFT_238283 [Aplosporella prunicola CBS 121167]KAF2136020.1 hypothetical protein K452DRAFT_238283 [Aplosporella prunicola CBS 121167]
MVRSLTTMVKEAAQRLPAIEDSSFGAMFDSFGQSRVVLIGDGSHGTSEFYRARAAITRHLIENHGFNIVAIEADWPDAKSVDRYVRQNPSQHTRKLSVFDHFPRWMWRNTEVQSFVDWLRRHNAQLAPESRTSFAGLDLYSMGTSIHSVQGYLDRVDPETAKLAKKRYGCLEPWMDDPAQYGRNSFIKNAAPCEKGVVNMLKDLLEKRLELAKEDDGEDFFDAEMNARLVRDAESYYRSMYYGSDDSWNQRDTHFFKTLVRLLQNRKGSKAVVWAHNSHVGDARYTGMGESRNELNIGQLCKEQWGASCSIIGCGTHTGTVAAADEWDEPMEVMTVNPSRDDSYERVMHDTGIPSFKLDLREGCIDDELRNALMKKRLERFIGVIYRPKTERWSHYSAAILPKQFDCFVWFDRTEAVHAFEIAQPEEAPSAGETYPFGL